jgi:hypothetical protein
MCFVFHRVDFRADLREDFRVRDAFVFLAAGRFFAVFRDRFLGARSGRFASPVSRFHSSNVSGEISPFTSSSANLRRCALLLNGITHLATMDV